MIQTTTKIITIDCKENIGDEKDDGMVKKNNGGDRKDDCIAGEKTGEKVKLAMTIICLRTLILKFVLILLYN